MQAYELLTQQGAGSFAVVWKARRRADGGIVAIKELKERGAAWDAVLALPEVAFGRALRHPNVLALHSVVRLREHTYIVMEQCDCNLFQVRWWRRRSRPRLPLHAAL